MTNSDTSSAKDGEKTGVGVMTPGLVVDVQTACLSEHSPEYERFLELDVQFSGENRKKFIRKGMWLFIHL